MACGHDRGVDHLALFGFDATLPEKIRGPRGAFSLVFAGPGLIDGVVVPQSGLYPRNVRNLNEWGQPIECFQTFGDVLQSVVRAVRFGIGSLQPEKLVRVGLDLERSAQILPATFVCVDDLFPVFVL